MLISWRKPGGDRDGPYGCRFLFSVWGVTLTALLMWPLSPSASEVPLVLHFFEVLQSAPETLIRANSLYSLTPGKVMLALRLLFVLLSLRLFYRVLQLVSLGMSGARTPLVGGTLLLSCPVYWVVSVGADGAILPGLFFLEAMAVFFLTFFGRPEASNSENGLLPMSFFSWAAGAALFCGWFSFFVIALPCFTTCLVLRGRARTLSDLLLDWRWVLPLTVVIARFAASQLEPGAGLALFRPVNFFASSSSNFSEVLWSYFLWLAPCLWMCLPLLLQDLWRVLRSSAKTWSVAESHSVAMSISALTALLVGATLGGASLAVLFLPLPLLIVRLSFAVQHQLDSMTHAALKLHRKVMTICVVIILLSAMGGVLLLELLPLFDRAGTLLPPGLVDFLLLTRLPLQGVLVLSVLLLCVAFLQTGAQPRYTYSTVVPGVLLLFLAFFLLCYSYPVYLTGGKQAAYAVDTLVPSGERLSLLKLKRDDSTSLKQLVKYHLLNLGREVLSPDSKAVQSFYLLTGAEVRSRDLIDGLCQGGTVRRQSVLNSFSCLDMKGCADSLHLVSCGS